LTRPQHVEAHARDDGCESRAEVLDVACIAATEPQPRLLHRILSVTRRAEYPVRYGLEVCSVILETIAEPILFVP
jgi:hypothetical protein